MKPHHDRRQFLEQLGIGAAGLIVGGYTATARGFAANETINVGTIGTGGRCNKLMEVISQVPGVRLAAVCDIWDPNIQRGLKISDPKAFSTKDYHELLARKDIDAVIIGSPDHWHVQMTADACAAGKDVYVEKPLTHDLSEGQRVIEAQNKHSSVVQVGTQQRSMPQFQKAYEIIRSGGIGKVHKVHLTWNRNIPRWQHTYGTKSDSLDWKRFLGTAKDQPFDPYRFHQWRWFWDFGGGVMTDLMVHYIDVVHWIMDVDHPETATAMGDNFATKDLWETPDCAQALMKYPDKQLQVYFESTFINARNAAMLEFMGTDATLYLDRGRYEILPERNRKIKKQSLILGEGARGQDFYENPNGELLHLNNWLECIRSRKKPHCPAEAGVSSASAAHMANRAYRTGQVAHWSDAGVPAANEIARQTSKS